MNNIGENLTIGVIGSVIGAILFALGQIGWRFSCESLSAARNRLKEERDIFLKGDDKTKNRITNEYLFSILKYLFIANFFWILHEFAEAALTTTVHAVRYLDKEEMWFGYWIFNLMSKGVGVLLFYFGAGKIFRYYRMAFRSKI